MTRTAKCCCGSASITVSGDPVLNAVCHCNDCKRRMGTAFGWDAYFLSERLVNKNGDWITYKPASQPGQIRRACKRCASTLWWTVPTFDEVGISGGAFLDPPLPEPSGTYQHKDHLPWLDMPKYWTRAT